MTRKDLSNQTLGDRIRLLRESKKKNQYELADILGVRNQTISNYESGERQPSYAILLRMAEVFEVSTDYLLGNSTAKTFEDQINSAPDEIRPSISKLIDVTNVIIERSLMCKSKEILEQYVYIFDILSSTLFNTIDTPEILEFKKYYIEDMPTSKKIKSAKNAEKMMNRFNIIKEYSLYFQQDKECINKSLHEVYTLALNNLYNHLGDEFKKDFAEE